MINLILSSKEDVHKLKQKLRNSCEAHGLRLGKSNEKVEKILSSLLGYRDFNTLISVATKPSEEVLDNSITENPSLKSFNFVERVNLPSTTYGAKDILVSEIHKAEGIRSIIFAVRNGELNESATTILLVADSGTKLFDDSLLTVERSPRELEILEIFNAISEKKCLGKTWFVNKRVNSTDSLPSIEAADKLTGNFLSKIFPEWKKFLSTYNKNYIEYGGGIYFDERWNALSKLVTT